MEFHQCHAKPHSICFFFYHIINENERNLCQDLLTIENTDSDLKVHAPRFMQMSCLYASDFPFKNFCEIAQHTETRVDKSTDHDKPYFKFYVFMFFVTISTSKKMFSFRARAEKGIARAAWLGPGNFLLVRSEHAHASYPGLFFRPPGFSPYMGREERRVQGLDYNQS